MFGSPAPLVYEWVLFLAKQCAAVIGGGAALKDLKNAGNKLSTFIEIRRFNLQVASSGVNQFSIPDTSLLVGRPTQ